MVAIKNIPMPILKDKKTIPRLKLSANSAQIMGLKWLSFANSMPAIKNVKNNNTGHAKWKILLPPRLYEGKVG
ncbi:hypothetical protein [Cardinium endosymbiont of Tipula unca]|uniref:hypothetical protein n=1 Tax=Cardinium endosymbiont of Tipula unca TaxID=3066216 RepID=UPI0030CD7A82